MTMRAKGKRFAVDHPCPLIAVLKTALFVCWSIYWSSRSRERASYDVPGWGSDALTPVTCVGRF